jgi:hypothetical protein
MLHLKDFVMSTINFERERRKQKALERLGTTNPICVSCGEADWRCLEGHHIAGKDYDQTIAIVCRNCHRKLSDDQYDHPPANNAGAPLILERIGRFLFGLADFLGLVVATLRGFGLALIELASQCDPSGLLLPKEA